MRDGGGGDCFVVCIRVVMVNHHKVNAEMDHVIDARAGGRDGTGSPQPKARSGPSLRALSLLEDIYMPT